MAVDMQSMIHADIMGSCVHQTAREKAAAHPITEPPPCYSNSKVIVLMDTNAKVTHLTQQQHVALHHFAFGEVPNYAKAPQLIHHLPAIISLNLVQSSSNLIFIFAY